MKTLALKKERLDPILAAWLARVDAKLAPVMAACERMRIGPFSPDRNRRAR